MGDVDSYSTANFTITEKKTKKVKKVSKRQTQENDVGNEVTTITETNGTRGYVWHCEDYN